MNHRSLDQLSKDEIFSLALYLDLPEILSLCRTAKKFNRYVCQNKHFWIRRLKQDFGFSYLDISPDKTGNPKEYYEFFHKNKGNNNKRLIAASKQGNIDIVRFLLENEANVHAVDDLALRWASSNGHTDTVLLLLDNEANIHAQNDLALILASKNGHTDTVLLLLENDANAHALNDWALRLASHNGHTDIVDLLLKSEANVHANNDYALRLASKNGHTDIVKLLKSYS